MKRILGKRTLMRAIRWWLPLLSFINAPQVFASMPQDPIPFGRNSTVLSPTLSLSDITYDPEQGNEFDIERKILGLGLSFPLGSNASGDFALGVITETEVENINEDGSGYQILFGGKGMIHRSGSMAINVHGSFSLLSETIKDGSFKVELETTELRLGSTISAILSSKIVPYAGLELNLLSDGKQKRKTSFGTSDFDYERDDMLGLRLGTKILVGQAGFKAEALLMGERTITLGVDIAL